MTLQGGSAGDGLEAPSPDSSVLTIVSQRVELNQLTVIDGARGVVGLRGAALRATNLHVTGASSAGILLQGNATALLPNTTVENGVRDGIELSAGARW